MSGGKGGGRREDGGRRERVLEILVGDRELGRNTSRLLSLTLLSCSLVILWLPYEQHVLWVFTRRGTFFRPDLISSLLALFIIFPLYYRRIFTFDRFSVYHILSFTLRFTLTASFCRILTGDALTEGIWSILLFCIIALSWFGIRSAGNILWALFLLVSFLNILINNYILGFNGYLFLVTGILGLMLGERITPAGFNTLFRDEMRGSR